MSISPATATCSRGRLQLGIIPTLAPYVLPRVLPRLQAKYPQLRLEVRETQTKLLLEELNRGELDAVMLALPVEGADVETLALFDDAFLLAVPAADALPARGRVGVEDVDQRRLILLEEGHCLRDQALAFCAAPQRDAAGRPRRHLARHRDADGGERLRRDAAAGGRGAMRKGAMRAVKLLRFSEPEPARTIGLAWRRTSPRRKDFAALGNIMAESLQAGRRPKPSRCELRSYRMDRAGRGCA